MNYLHQGKVFLLLLLCLFCIKTESSERDSSYFFYQQPQYPRDCKEARSLCSSDSDSGVYTIKPDGYLQPFEVYCNNDISSAGWIVILRRIDGTVALQRNWEEYKTGFGFLSSEFWIGLDKLSFLTNQAAYELRIDMTLSNGSYFYVRYNSFRISDEWGQYALVTADGFNGNSSCVVSTCPTGMTHGGCTCQRLCSDLIAMTDCNDNCIETCGSEGCVNGESYINDDCTQNCTCIGERYSCDSSYQCSPDATCRVMSGVRKCYCNDEYEGNGLTCDRKAITDCYDAYQAGNRTDGIYTILPTEWPGLPFEVFCNMTFSVGGWTVFQRRTDGVTDFYRNWEEYKQGFGTKSEGNDFWLGNEALHFLTNQKDYMLRIDFVRSDDSLFYEEYTGLKIGDESTKYQLSYTSYTGGKGHNNRLYANNNMQFSTSDQDNDGCGFYDCAEEHKGGWWYGDRWCYECFATSPVCRYFETASNCHNLCTDTNLNGDYNGGNGEKIFYHVPGDDCNLKFAEMKIRPTSS